MKILLEKVNIFFLNLSKKIWPFLLFVKGLLLKRSYLWVIMIIAFLARTFAIGNLGVSTEELKNIGRIFSMQNTSSFLDKGVDTNLYYFLQYIWGAVLGYSVFNMRLFSVIISLLGLYVFFRFSEEWFNRKLAYIATFLLSISSFHIMLSRNISHEVLYLLIVILGLHLLTLAYRYKMWQYFFLSGAVLGAGFYASEVSFVILLVFIFSGIYFYTKNPKFFSTYVREKVVFLASFTAVASLFFYSLVVRPQDFFSNFTYRLDEVIENAKRFVSSIVYRAPQEFMYNVGTDSVFDPYVSVTFLLGLIYIAMRVKRRKFFFLILWFAVLAAIIIFKKTFSLGDFIYIVPIMFIMSARIQVYVLDKWFKTFPFNKFARIVMVLGIGFMFALSMSYNYKKVFLAWVKYPQRVLSYNTEPTTFDPGDNKLYPYNTGYTKDVIAIVMKTKKGENILEVTDPKEIKQEKPIIITSNESVNKVKSEIKNIKFSEYKGKDIVLLKGE